MRVLVCACLLVLVPLVDASAQFGFLYRSGVEITGEDREVVAESLRTILNDGAAGQSLEWSNPASGLSGETTLIERFDDNGTPCAVVVIEAGQDDNAAPFRLTWCQRPDGRWGIAG